MTEEGTAPTCSTPTDKSDPWPAVVELGRKIEDELGLVREHDTLARWMAHRIAELIDHAERAGGGDVEAAKQRAGELILEVWGRRSDWPYGWPPEAAARITSRLTGRGRWRLGEDDDDPWLRALVQIDDIHSKEYTLILSGYLVGLDLTDEQRKLDTFERDISEQERDLIAGLLEAQGHARDRLRREGGEEALIDPGPRAQVISAGIEQLAQDRRKLLVDLQEALSVDAPKK